MSVENNQDNKKCSKKGRVMFAYGIIQLGSTAISAIALTVIALSLCSIKKEAKFFNECIEEVRASGTGSSDAVHFCNGGN